MADLAITAANVQSAAGCKVIYGVAGVALTAGQVVYLDATTSTYKLADADSATAALRSPAGIATNGAAAGQPVAVHQAGLLTIGATLTRGNYYASATPGGICPFGDLSSAHYVTSLGVAHGVGVLDVKLHEAGSAF